jgi:hypothetical protein
MCRNAWPPLSFSTCALCSRKSFLRTLTLLQDVIIEKFVSVFEDPRTEIVRAEGHPLYEPRYVMAGVANLTEEKNFPPTNEYGKYLEDIFA